MKTIKLTEKQFNIFKSIFEEGLNSRETTFENELDYEFSGDQYIGEPRCSKEVLKIINNQKRIIQRIENKLNNV